MRDIHDCNAFRKDVKRIQKRAKRMQKLYGIVEMLANDKSLSARHRPHRLINEWEGCWECHIEPDWLLIYEYSDAVLHLHRTGTHSDLFD